jgi:hypothetical protein
MSIRLRDLGNCFEGIIPSTVATVDREGMPNVSYLSQVYYVDETHVALSNQFFSKTTANVRENGHASVMIVDARTGEQYILALAYEGTSNEGELFERMAAQLRALSAQRGMEKIMALRSADLYRVLDCKAVPCADAPVERDSSVPAGERLGVAARLSAAIAEDADADAMLDHALDGLSAILGFHHAMVLVPDDAGQRLTTLASRGYDQAGVGSEVAFGDGTIGTAAHSRRPLRVSDMSRGRRMAAAILSTSAEDQKRFIPVPGLDEPQSQLAVPMISQGRLRGILFVESAMRFSFTQEDENALALIAGQLAAGLQLMEADRREAVAANVSSAQEKLVGAGSVNSAFEVKYFTYDGSIFLDDVYVIKGVPGRLLFFFLRAYIETGRQEFTNREIRLDPSLRLPDLKDNLETRLILLRRRLEERAAPVRLVRPARGRIYLDVLGTPSLEVVSASRDSTGE